MTRIPSEHDLLVGYLRRCRAAVVDRLDGVGEADARAAGVPSGTSLLGIVHHLTGVEQHWFRVVFRGERLEVDKGWQPPADASVDDVVARYREACATSDEALLATEDLTTLAVIANPGEDQRDTLRSIALHMIEETAQHAGHADVLRELLDGDTAS